jgi:hypothetical protein
MLSKKYFLGGGRNFSAPPARPTHAEVRDHIDPQESDHRASYLSYRALQQQGGGAIFQNEARPSESGRDKARTGWSQIPCNAWLILLQSRLRLVATAWRHWHRSLFRRHHRTEAQAVLETIAASCSARITLFTTKPASKREGHLDGGPSVECDLPTGEGKADPAVKSSVYVTKRGHLTAAPE